MSEDNKWSQPKHPPSPLFLGQKEKDLVKQVNDELIERVIGQQIVYYAIDIHTTNYHPLYGEAIEKNFLPPLHVYALVEWEESVTTFQDRLTVDKSESIIVHFHKRRLEEDQDLYVRQGDFVLYDDTFYEIVEVSEPMRIFGQTDKMEVSARCVRVRQGAFDAS